jgi:hypothetical protein
MEKVLLLAFMALASYPALGAQWTPIGSTENVRVFLDEDSIATRGRHRQAWFKYEYQSTQKSEREPRLPINQRLFLMYFDCIAKTGSYQRTQTRFDDKIIEDYWEKETYFTDIVPDTYQDNAASLVCSFTLSKQR